MDFMKLVEAARQAPVTAAIAGCGEFALTLIAQSRRLTGLRIRAVLDRDADRIVALLRATGHPAEPWSPEALASGGDAIIVCQSISDLLRIEFEVLVEATGDPEAATTHAVAAMGQGRSVAMVSKEAECVVGPALAARAIEAKVHYTLVDGDQPSLAVALISWARALGLPIIAAGKSSEHDFIFDPATGQLRWRDQSMAAPALTRHWQLGHSVAATLEGRLEGVRGLPLRTVPDFCEMCIVTNVTGLKPDRPEFHAPLARTTELADIYSPVADGGIIAEPGTIDVFNCLRRPDEVSFAGGVFVVVELADSKTGDLFAGKGIPVSRSRRHALIYNPSHLLGVEAPISIMLAARLDHDMIDTNYRPRVDLVARTKRDFAAGSRLAIEGSRHSVPDLEPLLMPAQRAEPGKPLPYYMAVGCRLARDVRAGELMTFDDVVAPQHSALWRLRAEQDTTMSIGPIGPDP